MTAEKKAVLWAQISSLLVEHERAQTDAMRMAIADTWEALRQRLQVLALDDEMTEDGA